MPSRRFPFFGLFKLGLFRSSAYTNQLGPITMTDRHFVSGTIDLFLIILIDWGGVYVDSESCMELAS